ncbi:hypothetical protein ACU6HM_06155 [Alcaligenes sp. RM2]|jgi:hypothetical protein
MALSKLIEIPGKLILNNKFVEAAVGIALIGAVAGIHNLGAKLLQKKRFKVSYGPASLSGSDDLSAQDSTKK